MHKHAEVDVADGIVGLGSCSKHVVGEFPGNRCMREKELLNSPTNTTGSKQRTRSLWYLLGYTGQLIIDEA